MKKFLGAALCVTAVLASTCFASAQVSTVNVVGYVNQVWPEDGYLLINNPLSDGTNTAVSLFAGAPEGTRLSVWDAASNGYSMTSEKIGGSWTVNLDLPPGRGALLHSPLHYTNTYVGEVIFDGGSTNLIDLGDLYFYLPVPPEEPGNYLLGIVAPFALGGTDVFLYAVGRDPEVGESITRLVDSSGTLLTHTYLGGDVWSNGDPTLGVAESAFFNIGGVSDMVYVPEPATFTLLGLGSLGLIMVQRRR